MKLIHYGKSELSAAAFNPIFNGDPFVKPRSGGLWASPVDSSFGWKDWCEGEEFRLGHLNKSVSFEITGNIYTIDSLDDLLKIPYKREPLIFKSDLFYPDFEKMAENYDAIYLTERGQARTRMTSPNLYGWDCECVLVLNWDCVIL